MEHARWPRVRGVFLIGAILALLTLGVVPSRAQTIDPFYAGSYTYSSLGTVSGVPTPYGGLMFKPGDLNTLLLGGSANNAAGAIFQVGLVRGAGNRITGFTGAATLFATAPNIDGGLDLGPGGVIFYTGYPINVVGQIKPGSVAPDKITDVAPLGIAGSLGSLAFVPGYAPGAGRLKAMSWSGGQFYDVAFAPDGAGTFNLTSASQTATLVGGPEGFTYVPTGSPLFGAPSMLVSEYSAGNVATYQVDAQGNPIVATRRTFLSGLTGAEGAVIDPLTGDYLFSTFGGANQVVRVSGFAAVPEPSTLLMIGLGLAGVVTIAHRHRRARLTATAA